jgi:hypothetical protein
MPFALAHPRRTEAHRGRTYSTVAGADAGSTRLAPVTLRSARRTRVLADIRRLIARRAPARKGRDRR